MSREKINKLMSREKMKNINEIMKKDIDRFNISIYLKQECF